MSGVNHEDIIQTLEITRPTYDKVFKDEKKLGTINLVGKAGIVISKKLSENSLDAAKFVLSRVAPNWKENLNLTSDDGSMSPPRDFNDFYKQNEQVTDESKSKTKRKSKPKRKTRP